MVTNVSNSASQQILKTVNSTSSSTAQFAIVSRVPYCNYERVGPGGVQERLGAFNRLSAIPILLIMSSGLLGLSGYYLLRIVKADMNWYSIMWEDKQFPSLKSTSSRPTSYFEGTKLDETKLGRMLKKRAVWLEDDIDFGLARGTELSYPVVIFLFASVGLLSFHLLLVCLLKRFRRKFRLISLLYGLVGLLVFSLFLTKLYFSAVHKISCYLENAKIPPEPDASDLSPNSTVDSFINMTLSCAFAYSVPNPYAKERFKFYPERLEDDFNVDGIKYSKKEMMQLGICPRQDDLWRALIALALTTTFCWFVSAYSEVVENRLLGPPVWLQRFKVKVHKGIRHWQTRTQVPTYLEDRALRTASGAFTTDLEAYARETPNLDNPYSVMDGGIDHFMLADPLSAKPSVIRFL